MAGPEHIDGNILDDMKGGLKRMFQSAEQGLTTPPEEQARLDAMSKADPGHTYGNIFDDVRNSAANAFKSVRGVLFGTEAEVAPAQPALAERAPEDRYKPYEVEGRVGADRYKPYETPGPGK